MANFYKLCRNKVVTEHNKLFGGRFMKNASNGSIFYEDNNDEAYYIDDEKNDDIIELFMENIETGINTIPEKWKSKIIKDTPGILN